MMWHRKNALAVVMFELIRPDLWRAVVDNPTDHTHWLILADWLEENGDRWRGFCTLMHFASAVARRKLVPDFSGSGKTCCWYLDYDPDGHPAYELPWEIHPSIFMLASGRKMIPAEFVFDGRPHKDIPKYMRYRSALKAYDDIMFAWFRRAITGPNERTI